MKNNNRKENRVTVRHIESNETHVVKEKEVQNMPATLSAMELVGTIELLTVELRQNRILNESLAKTMKGMDRHIQYLEKEVNNLRFSMKSKESLKVVPIKKSHEPKEALSWFDRLFRPWKMRRSQ
ncbi:hypothetical protein ACFL35_06945 [Candidatus Riflebacteria bacterium]